MRAAAAFCLWLAALPALAASVPASALVDTPEASATVARAEPRGEPLRIAAEVGVSLAAFTALNLAGALLLSSSHVTVRRSSVSLDGSGPQLAFAAACFALSPLAAALGSSLVGRGSDAWEPQLRWAALGAYGASALAVGAGLGLSAANVDRGTAQVVNTALYLAVPLTTVLLQNVTKVPRNP